MEENQCPRCGGMIPTDERPGAYPGALSRHERTAQDEPVEICSACGVNEAIRDFTSMPPVDRGAWFDRRGGL